MSEAADGHRRVMCDRVLKSRDTHIITIIVVVIIIIIAVIIIVIMIIIVVIMRFLEKNCYPLLSCKQGVNYAILYKNG